MAVREIITVPNPLLKKAGADLKASAQKAKSDVNNKSDHAEDKVEGDKSERDKSQG